MAGKKGDPKKNLIAILLITAILLSILGTYMSMVVYNDYKQGFKSVTKIESNTGPKLATVGVYVIPKENQEEEMERNE